MLVRLMVIFFAVLGAPGALAESRPFDRADYETYFSPGRFVTHSPYYGSEGVHEIMARRGWSFAGRYFLRQSFRSIDVSANYDEHSDFPFYKIVSEAEDDLVWDQRLSLYVFETTRREFDSNESRVWESHDLDADISPGDRAAGLLHPFYHAADRKAGRDVKALHDQHRKDVTGAWTWRCRWLDDSDWDVECASVHVSTQREELYYYRKDDLLG